MPRFPCANCRRTLEVNTGEHPFIRPDQPERLIGSAFCRHCEAWTAFELEKNLLAHVAGKSSYGSIDPSLSEIAKSFYAEAEMCYRSGTPNAAASMCRASIESALNEKGVKGNDLNTKIGNAKDILNETEMSLAHGSRLITRDAIHREILIPLSDIPAMLSVTVRVLNKIASYVVLDPK